MPYVQKKSNSKLILLTHGYSDLNIKSMGADFVLDNLKEIPNLITNEKFYLTK